MEDNTNGLLKRIAEKQKKLAYASGELKKHFVGLDTVIDKIISGIEAWYCMPEISTRPTIVNLWGLTGNGKTDLVRRLSSLLDMADRFVEIQMTNKGSSQHTSSSTMQGLLSSSNLVAEEPGILLLDEIQRFRSIDNEGNDISDYQFQDLWMLLSDGSFGSATHRKEAIMDLLCEALYYDDIEKSLVKKKTDGDDDEEDTQESLVKRRFKQGYWSAKKIKKVLCLEESVEDIMQWDNGKKIDELSRAMNDKGSYEPEVYSKLLIIISGNLDEAYRMASQTDETDIDADIFHKNSLEINLLSIKSALRTRFKPEQIARFGNTHIIYPALSRNNFEEIIRKTVTTVLENTKNTSGVNISVDQSVYDAIYRNGVFPTQGTRPVFSTISSLFESALPKFTLACLKSKVSNLSLSYANKCLFGMVKTKKISVKNEGDIDKIKENNRNECKIQRVSVHEASHAVVYSKLFGVCPTQIVANAASEDKNGFIGIHNIDPCRQFLLNQITALLAGRVGEEIVFGINNIGAGAVGDITRATAIAANFVRHYGMQKTVSKISTVGQNDTNMSNLDIEPTNKEIEAILSDQKDIAYGLLKNNLPILRDVTEYLVKHEKIDFEAYRKIFESHGSKVEFVDAKETLYANYDALAKEFWKKL